MIASGESMLLGSLSRHNKNLEWRTLKPLGGSQLSGVGQTSVIALKEISVTAQCYSSILLRREQENPSSRCEETRREERPVVQEREKSFGSSFYVFSSPWACPRKTGLRQERCSPWSPHSALRPSSDLLWPSSDLPLFYFRGLFPPCLSATSILDSFSLF